MKTTTLFTLLTAAATAALAAPALSPRDDATTTTNNMQVAAGPARLGTPHCKSSLMFDLCTANNIDWYCTATGFFYCELKSCKGACWCA
ncbi:hypothetical protein BT67DRAFT_441708 [Trichocladium antarcticum]|uniref:Uncharacterized protein n=1 Tax=Trichocladium antarcticum TaxID=1450529 RepID=A0AAN6UK74_9PEZI|nr:hypothetical protein BT67DRAFT_441708 [Trichocladium antarcticum]